MTFTVDAVSFVTSTVTATVDARARGELDMRAYELARSFEQAFASCLHMSTYCTIEAGGPPWKDGSAMSVVSTSGKMFSVASDDMCTAYGDERTPVP